MSDYPFQNIILKEISDGSGWQIIGVRHDLTQEVINSLTPGTDPGQGQKFITDIVKALANKYARDLAGKSYAKVG